MATADNVIISVQNLCKYFKKDAIRALDGISVDIRQGDAIVPVLDEVCRAVDHVLVDPWIQAGATVAVGNISELATAAQTGATADRKSVV